MNAMSLRRGKSAMSLPFIKPHFPNSFRNHHQKKKKKRGKSKYLCNRMKMLRTEMEEISEEQKKIKEGQRQVREKFEAIELECEELRNETKQIMRQSMSTQIRLAFMFQILKARENNEFDKAAQFTAALRELIAREKSANEHMKKDGGTWRTE